jgi:hypothetical protein
LPVLATLGKTLLVSDCHLATDANITMLANCSLMSAAR